MLDGQERRRRRKRSGEGGGSDDGMMTSSRCAGNRLCPFGARAALPGRIPRRQGAAPPRERIDRRSAATCPIYVEEEWRASLGYSRPSAIAISRRCIAALALTLLMRACMLACAAFSIFLLTYGGALYLGFFTDRLDLGWIYDNYLQVLV
jgi:hypothetical protein